jgi:hypothetical protein
MLWTSLSLVLALAYTASCQRPQVVEDLAANCRVTISDRVYNLCSLSHIAGNVLEYELPSSSSSRRTIYRLNVDNVQAEVHVRFPRPLDCCSPNVFSI